MENMPSNNGQTPGNAGRSRRLFSSLISLLLVALMIGLIWSALKVDSVKVNEEYYQVVQYFDEGKISEYELNLGTRKLTYVLRGEKEKRTYTVPSYDLFIADVHDDVRTYNQAHPDDPIKMNYESGTSNYWLVQMLPMVAMLIMMGLMLYFMVKKISSTVQDDTKRSMAFGKVHLKSGDEGRKTTFDDVAGLNEEKEDLEEIVEFLKNPQRFNDLGARIPKGVLLVGPPGTGKTLLARAVAGEADATFLSISGSDFVEMFVGVGASRVRDLFDTAKKNVPAIVFIDEIDAVGRHRGAGMGGGHDEREQTLNQLLVEMDGFGENAGVIIIAATNRPDILDPALLRPGRFDRQVTVNYPDVVGREAILKVHARNKPIGPDVRLDEIARATAGFTGADLENLLNEAALLSARRGKRAITKTEIEEATIKVVVGTEKKSKKITDDEKRLTAYHEAGHAVTNYYLPTLDPVHQVSIIPRGMAGGYTMSLPETDKSYMSKKQMLDELVSLLGGRVSEAIILGDISTGASNDIERATNIARNMIVKYGMSEKLGPITFGSDNDEVFIGRDYSHVRNYSEETASVIDKEIEKTIMAAYDRADEILRVHIDKLHLLANFLMKYEKIDGATFQELMANDDFDIDSYDPTQHRNLIDEINKHLEKAEEPEKVEEVPEVIEVPEDTALSAGIALAVADAILEPEPIEPEPLPEPEPEPEPIEPIEPEPIEESEPEVFLSELETVEPDLPAPELPIAPIEPEVVLAPVEPELDLSPVEPELDFAPVEPEPIPEEEEEVLPEPIVEPEPISEEKPLEEVVAEDEELFNKLKSILDAPLSDFADDDDYTPVVDFDEAPIAIDEEPEPEIEPEELPEAPIPVEEPVRDPNAIENILSEAELELKRELDRENGLISPEDEYADADISQEAIDDADINDYLMPEIEPAKVIDDSPAVEGLSGSGLSFSSEEEKKKFEEEVDNFQHESLNIGGFLSNIGAGADALPSSSETLPTETEVAPATPARGEIDISEITDEEVEAALKEEMDGTFTENDEIYALYELLKATRTVEEEDDSPFGKNK